MSDQINFNTLFFSVLSSDNRKIINFIKIENISSFDEWLIIYKENCDKKDFLRIAFILVNNLLNNTASPLHGEFLKINFELAFGIKHQKNEEVGNYKKIINHWFEIYEKITKILEK